MSGLVPELASLPPGLVLDGELVAFDGDGLPSFPLLCRRMLHGDEDVAVCYLAFDLLAIDGEDVMAMPYGDRRELLDELELAGQGWRTPPYTTEGAALARWVLAQGLEGVVAKRLDSPYRPGRREWVKIKNPAYWRRDEERAAWRSPGCPPRAGDG
jgi:bifunctional non-homologous end joining protein LigD